MRLLSAARKAREGYRTACAEVGDEDLRYLFGSYALQRSRFAAELKEVISAGGAAADDEEQPAAVRPWFDLEALVAPRDDRELLRRCFQGEEAVLGLYRDVVQTELPEQARLLAVRQMVDVEAAHARLRELYVLLRAG